ncbi:hypothetical protein [Chromobacterium haemolyticum]|uniref:hypothetical protein n=1 Tax=Chromobacterium haemolyticum TaxID=394935 RepID=UPI0005BC3D49|nr:hypothetical protein [Chromobacterium haemolyticum]
MMNEASNKEVQFAVATVTELIRNAHLAVANDEGKFIGDLPPLVETINPTSLDSRSVGPHNEPMSTAPTREEFEAKLETIETKMDARVQRIEEKATRIEEDMRDIKSEMKNMKWWMLGTGVSVIIGIAAFNATVLSNMVASFESGKNTAQAIDKAQTDLQKREERLDAIDKKLDKLIAAPPQPQK